MKFLVKETIYYVDGHGTPDKGEVEKFITDKKIYKYTNPNKYYQAYEFEYIEIEEETKEEIDEVINELQVNEDRMGAEDGYNCIVCKFVVSEITEEKAEEIQNIIDQYKNI